MPKNEKSLTFISEKVTEYPYSISKEKETDKFINLEKYKQEKKRRKQDKQEFDRKVEKIEKASLHIINNLQNVIVEKNNIIDKLQNVINDKNNFIDELLEELKW